MIMWLLNILQAVCFILFAPLLIGLLRRIKFQLQNRKGPSIFQPYRDLQKLFNKDLLIADNASIIFKITPYIVFGITCTICFIIPLFNTLIPLSATADIIVLVGFFGLTRFFLTLAGMDIGTAFGGMGSSREMMLATITEPALLMAFLAIATLTSSTNLANIISFLAKHALLSEPSLIFVSFGFALIALAETGRIPIDNPTTHLELTMIHEAMILEYSGRHLALIEWAGQIKFILFCALFINLFFPWGISTNLQFLAIVYSLLLFIWKLLVLIIVLAIAEINLSKLRLFRAPNLLIFAFAFCLLGLLIHVTLEI